MRQGARRLPKPPGGSGVPTMNLSRAFDRAGRRDSDATSVSSLPSSTGTRISISSSILSDRGSQASALSYVNSFLISHQAPVSLKPPYPSGRDIVSAFQFILLRLDFPVSDKSFLEDLLSFLQLMSCPVKINKSALKAPGTPHIWPTVLAVLYWLTQLAALNDHLSQTPPPDSKPNDLELYITQSYSLFLSGDDAAVEELDEEYASDLRARAAVSSEQAEGMEKEIADLEAKLEAAISGPSPRDELEKKRGLLMEDKKKFEAVVETWTERLREMEETRDGLEKELEVKNKEYKRLSDEKNELEKRIGLQGVSVRDMDRMKREMQAMERDIEEAKNAKSVAEEKVWEAEAGIAHKLDEMEVVLEQCNQVIRKLKLETEFQYMLNAKGSTPVEVIGAEYKTVLKPALQNLEEEMKKISVSKLEESIALQEELQDKGKVPEEKKKFLTTLQGRLDDIEDRYRFVQNEMEKYRATCAAETKKMKDNLLERDSQTSSIKNEAQEFRKNAEMRLRDAVRVAEEETQRVAYDLIALMDVATEFKEHEESMTVQRKSDLAEYIDFVAALSTKVNSVVPKSGLKRARSPSVE
ncbi:Kinetochore protein NDC80 [Rhynchospora pubera]|uniref:Kinetochore protein NDC80 n=1 Tax=Rhynchospora pubera TaxID=906938 RepID=A0AAV8BRS3_9POAL|nr:Kinetochore protein NDC80 [Rhynchospora pubera]